MQIKLDTITRSPFQVREDNDEDLDALAADMAANGLVQPVTVRHKMSPKTEGGPALFELVAGHRRCAAARKLGWTHISAIIVEADDNQAEAMLVAENFARRDLTPLEMADTAGALVERHGAAEAGRICGKSERWAQRMAYISGRLSEDWRRVARRWTLSQASLQAICSGTAATQRDTLAALMKDNKAKSLEDFLALYGNTGISELDDGGDPDSLLPNSDAPLIENIPWAVCGCGDCDGCQERSDAVPELLCDDDYSRKNPECLNGKCYASKLKEWLAERGLREWSRKLGRAVREQPKGINSWDGAKNEDPHHPIPVMIIRDYNEGLIRWFSETVLSPKKKPEKAWPTEGEIRQRAMSETLRAWLLECDDMPAALNLYLACCSGMPLNGKSEWEYGKRLALLREMSNAAICKTLLETVAPRIETGMYLGSGKGFADAVAQLVTGGSEKALAGLKAEADALAERRIADIEAQKKAEKAKKRRAGK